MSDTLITDFGLELHDGDIVVLARFPGIRWILHKGWYSYQGSQFSGWYFCAIPSQTTIPVNPSDLIGIQVVSGCSPGCNPNPPCPPNHPVFPGDTPFTPQMANELNRAWITVDSTEQLSRLNRRLIPNGKIVRVNDTGNGTPGYYRYNQPKSEWEPETFGIDTSSFITSEELPEQVKDIINTDDEVQTTITNIAVNAINWHTLDD